MALRTVILWVHVLCGVVWVGASAGIALAAAALSGEPEEWTNFATRSVPRINRVCVAAASVIPVTGIANLAFVARTYRGALPAPFIAILSAKVAIFAAMAAALWAAWGAGSAIEARRTLGEARSALGEAPRALGEAGSASGGGNSAASIRKLIALYATIVILGAMALGLGLWLSGT
jgi:uncharacterized membrane protein